MAVVTGEHHAVRQQRPVVGGGETQRLRDGRQRLRQEYGGRPLLGLGADLLVVKHAQHRHHVPLLRRQKALGAGKHTGQIVQPGGRYELALRSPDGPRLVVVQHQIPGYHVLRGAVRRSGHLPIEAATASSGGVQGHQITGRVVLDSIVGLPVQVDGHTGDQGHIPLQIHQTGLQSALPADQYPTRHTEGPIQPAVIDHAAIALGGQADILPRQLRMIPQTEAGGVRMAGGQQEAGRGLLRDAESHQRGTVLGGEVLPSCRQLPPAGPQLRVSFPQQTLAQLLHGVEAVGAALDVLQHCRDHLILPFSSWVAALPESSVWYGKRVRCRKQHTLSDGVVQCRSSVNSQIHRPRPPRNASAISRDAFMVPSRNAHRSPRDKGGT